MSKHSSPHRFADLDTFSNSNGFGILSVEFLWSFGYRNSKGSGNKFSFSCLNKQEREEKSESEREITISEGNS
jgi:hypothetical protein